LDDLEGSHRAMVCQSRGIVTKGCGRLGDRPPGRQTLGRQRSMHWRRV